MLQNAGVLYILPCKCASRHSSVPFLVMWTSKSGPRVWCFPTFWLTNMLRATAACHFSTSELPKWLRPCGVFHILTYKYASRPQRACHFWTSELPKWLRPCGVFHILTYKYASRHSACHFLNSELPKWLRECGVFSILTCKCASRHSGVQFFEHQNFQNGSANVVFWAFWLANVLRATAACHFSPVCQNSYLRTPPL